MTAGGDGVTLPTQPADRPSPAGRAFGRRRVPAAALGKLSRARVDPTVFGTSGNPCDVQRRSVVALCRCGASTTKPFCDKTHSKIGFAAAERAVAAQESG